LNAEVSLLLSYGFSCHEMCYIGIGVVEEPAVSKSLVTNYQTAVSSQKT
jgi:hypothetical protein